MKLDPKDIVERYIMIFESKRLESFKKWPYSEQDTCSVSKMAEAGFFWTGTPEEPDSAQCCVCNKQMDGWESTDDPWEEHKSHAEKCPFVIIGKSQDMMTCNEIQDLWKAMAKNLAKAKYKVMEKELLDDYNDAKKTILDYQKNGARSNLS